MNKTVEVSDEVYEQLERQAQARGITVGETIAQLLEEVEMARRQAVFAEMRAEGLFADPPASVPLAPADFHPIQVQGTPLSQVIIEERS
jgi:hypothetical protein